ncbi:MAG: hydroxyacylglutathione hydrolase [Proteobacteria bacterium]|nr:hydroxyacylglutathione hydrolase [Pseudomonadota bacterium]
MKIEPIRAFQDNYIWLLTDQHSSTAWVVDPGEAHNLLAILQKRRLELTGILITHHHADHCGGVAELLSHYPNVFIYGADQTSIPQINHPVHEGETFDCMSMKVTVLAIPGHTLDHVAYLVADNLFCGDTLFSVGCGKIFEGTAAQMYHSLNKINQLDEATKIYCGHEYTLANLNFAQLVDPDNPDLHSKLLNATHAMRDHGCTLPSSLKEERKSNPFLRCTAPEIIENVSKHIAKNLVDPIEVFYYLRAWKNKEPNPKT